MNSFEKLVAEDIRLSVLLVLLQGQGYSLNEFVMRSALALPVFAHNISTDKLRTELSWLSEQGLIECDQSNDVWSAKLTRRGKDVAEGLTVAPGVKRPQPEH